MCNEVDSAIDAGIENGFIATTNVMLNMKTLSDAADLLTRYPSLSVGIHWNVTTGKPISDPKTIPSLVDEMGTFWSIGIFKRKYHNAEITPADLEKELEAQYSLFEKTCGKPDYWNTHENVHVLIEPIKEMMLNLWQNQSQKLGVSAPDGILVRMNEDDKLNLPYLFSHIAWKSAHVVELAIHPSINGNNKYLGKITDLRVKEYQCFSS